MPSHVATGLTVFGVDLPAIPGPDLTDPILLAADQGFAAEIDLDAWLLVGGVATVRRSPNQGPWPGVVRAFSRAVHSIAEWHLATGERRQLPLFSTPDQGFVLGHQFPVKLGGNEWQATVVETSPATKVAVSFTIQSGATRRRDFFRQGQLDYFVKLSADGMVAVHQLPPLAT